MNARNRDSFRQLFKNLKILPLKSQYIFSVLLFVAKNRDLYESNSEIHNVNTRFSSDFYILQLQTLQLSRKDPFILESKSFLPASKMHLMT